MNTDKAFHRQHEKIISNINFFTGIEKLLNVVRHNEKYILTKKTLQVDEKDMK